MSSELPEKLRAAFGRFRAQDLAGAERLCGEILRETPRHPDALHLLGVVRLAGGNAGDAVSLINQALEGSSRDVAMLENLGVAHLALRNFASAEALFRDALTLGASHGPLYMRLGIALSSQGKLADGVVALQEAAARSPEDPDVHLNLGNALAEQGRAEEALACYQRVLALQRDHPAARFNVGNLHRIAGRLAEAETSYMRVLAVAPNDADVHNNLGLVYERQGRLDEAAASFRQALALRMDHVAALNNLGDVLGAQGRLEEAAANCERALAVRPDFLDALVTLGNVRAEQARPEEAQALYERALRIDPDCDYARGSLLRAQMQCCEWAEYDESAAQISEGIRAGRRADIPFNCLAVSESAADQLRCSRNFVAEKYPAAAQPVWRGERYRHDKIRLAYLSADFRDHAMAYLMAGLFEAHDKRRFEATAISFWPAQGDEIGARLRAAFDRFIDVKNKSDREVALLLRELEIDIVVDLMGFTKGCRPGIMAHRAAPVQVNYLGYPGTMGADYIDYIIGDQYVIPQEQQLHYTEKIVYLPESYQPNDSKRRIAERTPARAELGFPAKSFVFCCFNNNYKINPRAFDVWMRLLNEVQGSVFWLLEYNEAASRNLRREAGRRGVAPGRLIFAPRVRLEEHLARQRQADLFLDTLPYNAHTTASDALWAGLPVLTHMGSAFAGRVAASLLSAVGLPELITTSWEDYQALALKLASDSKLLADIKAKLARNRATHPLFSTDRFRRHLEAAYVTMWERNQRGEPPASFAVPRLS